MHVGQSTIHIIIHPHAIRMINVLYCCAIDIDGFYLEKSWSLLHKNYKNPGTRGDGQAVILHGKLISWAGGGYESFTLSFGRSMVVGSWDPELGDACLNLGG